MKIEQWNCGTKQEEQTSIKINPATASQLTVADSSGNRNRFGRVLGLAAFISRGFQISNNILLIIFKNKRLCSRMHEHRESYSELTDLLGLPTWKRVLASPIRHLMPMEY
jgi:hypothetical protein